MRLIIFLALTGCTHVEWTCTGTPTVDGHPTSTVVKCGDRTVTITHPERKTPWCPKKAPEVKP